MKFSLTYISFRLFLVLLMAVVYALLLSVALLPIVSFSFGLLLLKSYIDVIILLGLGMLLVVAIPSTNYVKLDAFQRFVNYSALGIFYVSIWTLLSYLSSILLLGEGYKDEIRSFIPLSALIGLFMYIIYVLLICFRMVEQEVEQMRQKDEELDVQTPQLFPATEKDKNNGQSEAEVLERVAVKIGQKIHVIMVEDIIYIRSDGDYVQLVTDQNKFLKEETMKFFEASLPSSLFVRVHRSYIVNVEKILRIEMYEKQNQMLTLKNGDKIRASISGYKALRSVLNL